MEFYPPAVKQEPNSSPLNPLIIDEHGHRKWDDDVDDAEYSPQLMDLSTKKQQQQQQVNNNYFFGTPLFPHQQQQECFFDYPPPHPEFYAHVQDFDTPMHHDDLDDASSQITSVSSKGKQKSRKKAAALALERSPPESETSRAVANHRERQRTKYLNTVLEKLRHIVPSLPSDKLSKKQILMLAAQYIEFLSEVVQCNQSFRGPVSRPSSPYKIREELGYCFRVWRMQSEYHNVDCPQ